MLIAGIDEAGRGPVIGPMVLAGISIKEKDLHRLGEIKVKDSKLLTISSRKILFKKIKEIADKFKIIIVAPEEIDRCIRSASLNLNWLEAVKTAEIIDALKPDRAIVDCPSNNLNAYRDYLLSKMSSRPELIIDHKADAKYEAVSAASILAKVTRDNEIKRIEAAVGEPIGSGYPSDPVTVRFLRKNHSRFPGIFRKEWASWKNAAKKTRQKNLADF